MTVSVLCHVGHSEIAYFVGPLWLVMSMWCTEGSARGSGDEDVDGEKLETARARSRLDGDNFLSWAPLRAGGEPQACIVHCQMRETRVQIAARFSHGSSSQRYHTGTLAGVHHR